MPILTVEQLRTHIYAGVRNAITGGDDTIVQDAIDAAIAEAKGYCSRYDISLLFDNPPGPVDAALLMHVKNLAKYHFLSLSNPNIDTEDALNRYERSVQWLNGVQAGRIVPPGWPAIAPADKATFFHSSSNTKRNNHFK